MTIKHKTAIAIGIFLFVSLAILSNRTVNASLPTGKSSSKVALVPGPTGLAGNGGTLPTSGFPGGYSPTFVNLSPDNIKNDASDPIVAGNFDTVVFVQIYNIQNYLASSTFKSRIDNFISNGGKLIIWDSECTYTDYSQFVYPFSSNAPGAYGSSSGSVWIVENNTLSTNDTSSNSYVNTGAISGGWDIGDANVMVTYDNHWYIDMVAKNLNYVVGPVQTYAEYGKGLIIWNGLDMDYMGFFDSTIANDNNGGHNLHYIWYLQLYQPFNPDNLPGGITVAGLTLSPHAATNEVGMTHTVTATMTDNLARPIPGVTVTFTIVSGPNGGTSGTNVTDANGKAEFSWTSTLVGQDTINATATSPFSQKTIFDTATKQWVPKLVIPEFWLGPIVGLTGFFAALGAFRLLKRETP
jgi:hypothetical protein